MTNAAKEASNFQVFSGFDSHLRSFFEHHNANEALKYSAIFQENDVNVGTIFYIFWISFSWPIDLDVLSMRVYSPLH